MSDPTDDEVHVPPPDPTPILRGYPAADRDSKDLSLRVFCPWCDSWHNHTLRSDDPIMKGKTSLRKAHCRSKQSAFYEKSYRVGLIKHADLKLLLEWLRLREVAHVLMKGAD